MVKPGGGGMLGGGNREGGLVGRTSSLSFPICVDDMHRNKVPARAGRWCRCRSEATVDGENGVDCKLLI